MEVKDVYRKEVERHLAKIVEELVRGDDILLKPDRGKLKVFVQQNKKINNGR